MSYRPVYTGKDENHFIPRDFARDCCGGFQAEKFGRYVAYTFHYRGAAFLLVDTSAYGGVMPDWILENRENGCVRWLEVKTAQAFKVAGHSLKPAEVWLWNTSPKNYRVLVDELTFEAILMDTMEAQ